MNADALIAYLVPERGPGLMIVWALWLYFGFWVTALVRSWSFVDATRTSMLRCRDASMISAQQQSEQEQEAALEAPLDTPAQVTSGVNTSDLGRRLQEYFHRKGLPPGSVIAEHLEVIARAGARGGRLDERALLSATSANMFSRNQALRSGMSLFIIMGLMGTLFGLAESVRTLSRMVGSGEHLGLQGVQVGMISALRSAFAPSIWGVAFTIAGVLLLTSYIDRACRPCERLLFKLTQTEWVPTLCPSPIESQRAVATLAQQQVELNRTAIQEFAGRVRAARADVLGFHEDVAKAQDVVKDLPPALKAYLQSSRLLTKQFSEQMQDFGKSFAEGARHISSFESELRGLYGKMADDAAVLRESVTGTLEAHNAGLDKILRGLRSYEEAYIRQRAELDSALRDFLLEAKGAAESASEQNRKSADALRVQVIAALEKVTGALEGMGTTISRIGGKSAESLSTTSEVLSGTQENFVKSMSALVGQLELHLKAQANASLEQLGQLTALRPLLADFLAEAKGQAASASRLSMSVNELAKSIAMLAPVGGRRSKVAEGLEGHSGTGPPEVDRDQADTGRGGVLGRLWSGLFGRDTKRRS